MFVKNSGLQIYCVIGYKYGCHVLRRKKTTPTIRRPFKMSINVNFWLAKFVLEVRQKDGKPYSPETLSDFCGLLYLLKEADRGEVCHYTGQFYICFCASWKQI